MASDANFHRYDDWPAENSTVRVPRITEADVHRLISGKELIEERGTTARDYVIREYRDLSTGETVWLGGDFARFA